jgi:hypothetical protein
MNVDARMYDSLYHKMRTRTDQQDVALFEGFGFFHQTKVDLVGLGFCLLLCSSFGPSSFPGSERTHMEGSGIVSDLWKLQCRQQEEK